MFFTGVYNNTKWKYRACKSMDFESEVSDKNNETDSDSDDIFLAHRAAAQGEINLLVQAVQKDPTVIEQEDADGFTPLAHAVRAHEMGAVKRLVKMGANVNSQDGQGRTCLSMAAYQGWYDGVIYLLRKGAKQNIPDKSGRTSLHSCTYDKDLRIIGVLLQKMSREDVNQSDNEKMTALHWAAFHDRPEHVQMLVMHGAGICCQDVDGKTPLHWAAQKGSLGSVQVLLRCNKGAHLVNQLDMSGKTAIHYASAAGHVNILEELVKVEDCELGCEDPDDRTPLHWAAAMGHHQCVSFLLKLKVSPNPVDLEGGTPLDYAQQSGHRECQILLKKALGIKVSPLHEIKQKQWRQSSEKNTKSRNPIGKLKDLFRARHKKQSGTPTSDVSVTTTTDTSNSIEMKVIVPPEKKYQPTDVKSPKRNSIEEAPVVKPEKYQDPIHQNKKENLLVRPKEKQNILSIPILTVSLPDEEDDQYTNWKDSVSRPVSRSRPPTRSKPITIESNPNMIVEHALIHREHKDSSTESDMSPKLVVPKIILSTVTDVDDAETASITSVSRKKKHRKSRKSARHSDKYPVIDYTGTTIQAIGSRASPNLPPVMNPRLSPLTYQNLTAHYQLASDPTAHRRQRDLVPLIIPSSKSLPLHSKVSALRKERGSGRRSPTPPPTIQLWPSNESLSIKRSPNPSPLQFDFEGSEHQRSRRGSRVSDFEGNEHQRSRRGSRFSEASSNWLTVDERDRFGGSRQDLLSVSSGSRSRLSFTSGSRSSIPSPRSDAGSIQLTPLNSSFGSNHTGTLLCASPVPMSKMEKKTLDRTIQSLLH